MRESDVPPAIRAALYQATALIPGVKLLGPQTDQTGQTGLGVAFYANGQPTHDADLRSAERQAPGRAVLRRIRQAHGLERLHRAEDRQHAPELSAAAQQAELIGHIDHSEPVHDDVRGPGDDHDRLTAYATTSTPTNSSGSKEPGVSCASTAFSAAIATSS